jgi:hypothetical protein
MHWNLLIALLEAKKHDRILTYENIGEALWHNDGGWDDARKVSLKEALKSVRRVIGSDSIDSTPKVGYYLTGEISELLVPSVDRKEYFEILWQNHHRGYIRDRVATGNVRELIDFFALPTIITANKETVSAPFSKPGFSKFLKAGSGFGKTTLLDMLLLCNVVTALFDSDPDVLTDNTKEKIEEYEKIRESLFGVSKVQMLPVYIHSDMANSRSYSSALELAEAGEIACFRELVDEAGRNGTLLFLIDSIDEVESDRLVAFLNAIKEMLSDYPKASVVFASRSLGKKSLPFEYDELYIKELTPEYIEKITYSILLSENEVNKLLERLKSNKYLRSLAKNPFMLTTILEIKNDNYVHQMLESIVNAIIYKRWDKHNYDITDENIKLLLGFLACKFVFENRAEADISEIRQCFIKAGDNMKLHGVSYDVPSQNIEYFLKTLSCQSGILNIVNRDHVEKYVFQDELVMCWLAANYIDEIIDESTEIHYRDGMADVWANVHWIDNFLQSLSSKELYLSSQAVNVLVMTLAMRNEKGFSIQKSILYFLICRDATSLDKRERLNIHIGYRNIVKNVFGVNDITNHPNSDAFKLIYRMLNLTLSEQSKMQLRDSKMQRGDL